MCSECVQSMFRLCSDCVQSVLTVCSECAQRVFRVCFISSPSASSVSVFDIFLHNFLCLLLCHNIFREYTVVVDKCGEHKNFYGRSQSKGASAKALYTSYTKYVTNLD